jgi:pyruvate dehydrogenase kinase 2/3/4
VDDVFAHAVKKQTGVALKYMLDFGANPIERQLILSAQVRPMSSSPVLSFTPSADPPALSPHPFLAPPLEPLSLLISLVSTPFFSLPCCLQFLHKELPVRLAHRAAELENLPYGLSAKHSVLKVSTGRHGRERGRAMG